MYFYHHQFIALIVDDLNGTVGGLPVDFRLLTNRPPSLGAGLLTPPPIAFKSP